MKIPSPGEMYTRNDGEIVQVTGILLDDGGILCVEYKVLSESFDISDAEMQPLGWFLGVEGRDQRFVQMSPPGASERPKTLIQAIQSDPRIVAWLEEKMGQPPTVPTVRAEDDAEQG